MTPPLSISDVSEQATATDCAATTPFKVTLEDTQALLEVLGQVGREVAFGEEPRILFDLLLQNFLALSGSEYGFIGEIIRNGEDAPFLKTHAITNIAWNDEMQAFYEQYAPQGLEFKNLDTLFGQVIQNGENLISNAPHSHPKSGGLPPGHPSLNAFLGIALYSGKRFVGMAGLANRKGGYDEALLRFLEPLSGVTANLINTFHISRERAQAQQASRKQFRLLQAQQETSPDGILVVDEGRRPHLWNQRLLDMWNIPEALLKNGDMKAVLNLALDQVVDPDGFSKIIENLYNNLNLVEGHPGTEIHMRDGRVLERHSRGIQDDQGKLAGRIWFYRDVTERKRLDTMKSDFISLVSHELRTPLTSIFGSLRILDSECKEGAESSTKTLLDVAARNCDRLLALVNDILDLEKIVSGRMTYDFQPMAINELVYEAVEENREYAANLSVELDFNAPSKDRTITGDALRLKQVMSNLLSNAAKFSPQNGRVEIEVTHHRNTVRIRVTDNGPGIAEEFHDKIFERFMQGSEIDTRGQKGTGLGLAISKAIVEAHDGVIDFDSREGHGATFCATLPAPTAT